MPHNGINNELSLYRTLQNLHLYFLLKWIYFHSLNGCSWRPPRNTFIMMPRPSLSGKWGNITMSTSTKGGCFPYTMPQASYLSIKMYRICTCEPEMKYFLQNNLTYCTCFMSCFCFNIMVDRLFNEKDGQKNSTKVFHVDLPGLKSWSAKTSKKRAVSRCSRKYHFKK